MEEEDLSRRIQAVLEERYPRYVEVVNVTEASATEGGYMAEVKFTDGSFTKEFVSAKELGKTDDPSMG